MAISVRKQGVICRNCIVSADYYLYFSSRSAAAAQLCFTISSVNLEPWFLLEGGPSTSENSQWNWPVGSKIKHSFFAFMFFPIMHIKELEASKTGRHLTTGPCCWRSQNDLQNQNLWFHFRSGQALCGWTLCRWDPQGQGRPFWNPQGHPL